LDIAQYVLRRGIKRRGKRKKEIRKGNKGRIKKWSKVSRFHA